MVRIGLADLRLTTAKIISENQNSTSGLPELYFHSKRGAKTNSFVTLSDSVCAQSLLINNVEP
jgi:hypothetical protein